MWEWLASPVDAGRAHEVGLAVSWHGRSMVLAWGVMAPLAVLIARFFKILPGQDWPRELDSQVWWRSHWIGQLGVVALTGLGIGLVADGLRDQNLHGTLGYLVCLLALVQVLFGVFRGSKGGPTAPARDGSLRGDHYDMTRWRVLFERVHKGVGYSVLGLAAVTILMGMWHANAPRWMWGTVVLWWGLLAVAFTVLQRRGRAVDTYQAIWGPGAEHPGNRRKPIGLGVRRLNHPQPGE